MSFFINEAVFFIINVDVIGIVENQSGCSEIDPVFGNVGSVFVFVPFKSQITFNVIHLIIPLLSFFHNINVIQIKYGYIFL